MKTTEAGRGYTLGYHYSPGLSSTPLKWLQQIIAHLFSHSPNMVPDLVELNKKKREYKPAFYHRKKKETHSSSLCDIKVPPPPPTPISNPPKTYTLSTCKQLLMWCWDPRSRQPGSGGFSRGYLEHTKGVLFVATHHHPHHPSWPPTSFYSACGSDCILMVTNDDFFILPCFLWRLEKE